MILQFLFDSISFLLSIFITYNYCYLRASTVVSFCCHRLDVFLRDALQTFRESKRRERAIIVRFLEAIVLLVAIN